MDDNTKQVSTPVTIDGVEYVFEDMTPQQQMLIRHFLDLDRKLDTAIFNLDQLKVGRDAFFRLLKESLDDTKKDAPV